MRVAWVDTAKALLIFLVVLGHCHYIYAPLPGKNLIYAFHVPAFLFITGFLMPRDLGTVPPRRLFSKWLFTYMRAYALFSMIAVGLWWLQLCVKTGGIANPLPGVWGALYGVGGSGDGLVHDNLPLWYFPFLVSSVLGCWLCLRLGRWGWGLAVAYAVFALLYTGPRLPWALDIAGLGTLVTLVGHAAGGWYAGAKSWFERSMTAVLLAALFGAVLVVTSNLNGATNLNGANFGANGLLFLIACFSGIAMIAALSAALPASKIAQVVAVDTLVIFALHLYFVRVLSKLAPLPDSEIMRTGIMLIISLGAVVICLGLARALRPVLDAVIFLRWNRPGGRSQ